MNNPVGKCPVCTINLYGGEVIKVDVKTVKGQKITSITGKPVKFPCGINREDQGRCPWETDKAQAELLVTHEYEKIPGILGTQRNEGIV